MPVTKRLPLFSVLFLTIFLLKAGCTQNQPSPDVQGPYLGQEPPGTTPELFAPGIISTDQEEGCSGFALNGKLFIFRREWDSEDEIYIIELKDDRWSRSEAAPFSSPYRDKDFTMAPDGKTLLFTSQRPIQNRSVQREDGDIWMVEKTDTGWSKPRRLDAPINTDQHESYPSMTRDGTLYFFCRGRGGFGKSDLFRSHRIDGTYQEPENLGAPINTQEHEWDPYIAPDESYLIFCSTKPAGYGSDDIYVAFRMRDGSWTEPVNMGGGVNSSASENRPYVSPDGKYFFFTSTRRGNRDIYWIDMAFLEALKPQDESR